MLEIPSDRSLCPVSYFLALAFADGVFAEISEPSQLSNLRVPRNLNALFLSYKPDKMNLPVLRCQRGHGVSGNAPDERIYTVKGLTNLLKPLGERAGYPEVLYTYGFQRGQAQKLDGKDYSLVRQKLL